MVAGGGGFVPGNTSWDFTRPNLAFWQHYEQRVAAVAALGVVPEIILFHPYDSGATADRRCRAEEKQFIQS